MKPFWFYLPSIIFRIIALLRLVRKGQQNSIDLVEWEIFPYQFILHLHVVELPKDEVEPN